MLLLESDSDSVCSGGLRHDDIVGVGCILGVLCRDHQPYHIQLCGDAGEGQIARGVGLGKHFFVLPSKCFCVTLGVGIYQMHTSDQEWKSGAGQIGQIAPKFQKEADFSSMMEPRAPVMKLCKMTASGNLEIPRDVRDKWLNDPVRRNLFPNSIFF